jgi:tetratricopeptide (TPR) repeat protein
MVNTFLQFGHRQRAEDIMAEMKTLAERSGQKNLLIMSTFNEAIMAIWDGRLEEAVVIRRRMLASAEELGVYDFAAMWSAWILPARVHLGEAGRALEANLQGSRKMPRSGAADIIILFCLAHLGRYGEVAEMLGQWVVARPEIYSAQDEYATVTDVILLENAVMAGHRQVGELLLRQLAKSSVRTSGLLLTTCAGRHMGAAAALLERPDEARKYYEKAIKDCTEIRFRPELALSRLQLAELLLEHYPDEKKEALEHLDFAIKEFQDMKMQPSLERALRHKDILKA